MADVGRRLAWAREIVVESQADACRILDIDDYTTWNKWEKGTRYPDPAIMVRFCDLFGLTMDWIYRGRLRGIVEEVQLRLVALHPETLDQDPDMGALAKAKVLAT